jgi:hypothetical protein
MLRNIPEYSHLYTCCHDNLEVFIINSALFKSTKSAVCCLYVLQTKPVCRCLLCANFYECRVFHHSVKTINLNRIVARIILNLIVATIILDHIVEK